MTPGGVKKKLHRPGGSGGRRKPSGTGGPFKGNGRPEFRWYKDSGKVRYRLSGEMKAVASNVQRVRERIAKAAARAGRDPAGVTLVAVTKSVGAGAFPALLAAGVRDIGENRVQDGVRKSVLAPAGFRWHLLGHLQTNKVKKALDLFPVLHSVDSARLAVALEKECARADREIDAFVEVNSGEDQKGGIRPGALESFWKEVSPLRRLRWVGLMTMAPFSEEAESSRPHFRRLREIGDEWRSRGIPLLSGLSMGMSGDFEVAVEEGTTHVRVGRALFEGIDARGFDPSPVQG